MSYTTIDNPALFFNTVIYAGSNSDQSITGVGFQPDWVWIKNRSSTPDHMLNDAVRGAGKQINSNTTTAELDRTYFKSFDSDGFSLEGNVSDYNQNSSNFVGWSWKAGGTASSNSDGSITSSVSANTTAGFSIVSYSGNSSTATVGHGLGAVPKIIFVKERTNTSGWYTYQEPRGNGNAMSLESTGAVFSTTAWNSTTPTSSVFSLGNNSAVNASGDDYIAYCFAEKKGYSKFGSYVGNGNADGRFVYTGFRPAFTLIKRSTASDNWAIYDNKRPGDNPNDLVLRANLNSAEYTGSTGLDFVSNGFKARSTDGEFNNGSSTYIYLAFAEHPFVTAGTKAAGTAR